MNTSTPITKKTKISSKKKIKEPNGKIEKSAEPVKVDKTKKLKKNNHYKKESCIDLNNLEEENIIHFKEKEEKITNKKISLSQSTSDNKNKIKENKNSEIMKSDPKKKIVKKGIKEKIENASTYLGKRGYILHKSKFTEKELENFREELNVTPFSNTDYGPPEEPFKVYKENSSHMYLPKFYGLSKLGKPNANITPSGKDIDISFDLSLQEHQKIPAQKSLEAYHEKGGGILSLPCAFGKTIIALYFVSMLKKKTLVIVHKEFLMNQWVERIQFALPSAKIGIIQGNKCEIEGKDIILGMLQTLSMRDFAKDTFDDIGHVIIDECHRIPSRIFSKALFRIHSTYMLGLSATPNRKDGLTKILKWFVGDIIYSVKSNEKNIVKVNRYLLQSDNESYCEEIFNFKGQVQMATMVNNITFYKKRTKLIIQLVKEELEKHEDRQFLILSDRRQQLNEMEELLHEEKIMSVGFYVGGMKKEKLKENESCRVLLGTFPMANEGLDIPSLNALVLATPKSDIIQTVGRISRVKHENIQALIFDMVDCFSIFDKQAKKRQEVYRKKGYEVEDIKYNVESNSILGKKKYYFHNILNKVEKSYEEENKNGESKSESIFIQNKWVQKENSLEEKMKFGFSKQNQSNITTDFENMDSKTYKIPREKVKKESNCFFTLD